MGYTGEEMTDDKLFQSLKLFIGDAEKGYERTIHELSLSGANLIYLTQKVLEFKYQKTRRSFATSANRRARGAHPYAHSETENALTSWTPPRGVARHINLQLAPHGARRRA